MLVRRFGDMILMFGVLVSVGQPWPRFFIEKSAVTNLNFHWSVLVLRE
jgi:hypothetical protein